MMMLRGSNDHANLHYTALRLPMDRLPPFMWRAPLNPKLSPFCDQSSRGAGGMLLLQYNWAEHLSWLIHQGMEGSTIENGGYNSAEFPGYP